MVSWKSNITLFLSGGGRKTIFINVVATEYELRLTDLSFVPVDLELPFLEERKKFFEATLMLFMVGEGNQDFILVAAVEAQVLQR